MKVLVCVASKYGTTAEIARAAADLLAERGCEVTVIPAQQVGAIEEFDTVLLGSAVYMGHWMKPARAGRWVPGPGRCWCRCRPLPCG